MRRIQAWLMLMTGVLALVSSIVIVQGNNSIVTYDTAIKYQLQVIVIGNGKILDGAQKIREGINIYELSVNDQKMFRLKADKNNQLKSVVFNGASVPIHDSQFTITMPNYHSVLIVAFEQDSMKDEDTKVDEKIESVVPSPPPDVTEDTKKETIAVITKKIPLDELQGEISDELLKTFIQCPVPYKILSHNVQAKPGFYEIVIQLEDGSIQRLPIGVVDNSTEDGGGKVESKDCYIHYYILLLFLLYGSYMGYNIYKNTKQIKEVEEMINDLESWEE